MTDQSYFYNLLSALFYFVPLSMMMMMMMMSALPAVYMPLIGFTTGDHVPVTFKYL